ncbi:MAG TPA: hypothetical protein LFW11_02430 [Rickettsia endosymbiont of Proechinophthirus fluctus]|uniref:hypothetical protein n=1 Tax=Rickettsia endosymbiont of Proechinophthirus fluctus TaxID=1462733 RepID=UPI000A8C2D62|nr:hypothetical protein [Rickettsia endosymbiont of Proechinophthirus fluctus]HJD54223.1 hypothetical protein [Rickettsia endosymbiont of Proechinophthirus fluctus]
MEQLKYIAMTGGVDANDDLKVVNNLYEASILMLNTLNQEIALLNKFKSVATPEAKHKLLDQFKNYVNQNLVELESKQSSIPIRQSVMKLADPAIVVNY